MTSYGLARVLSKRGLCSRTEAMQLIRAGRVRVSGRQVLDPESRTALEANIEIDGAPAMRVDPIYVMLNKPRGLVVTARDEKGRATIFDCFAQLPAQHLAPVGRLDQASEGLLLLSNDPAWAASLSEPSNKIKKIYHVQIDAVLSDAQLATLRAGVQDEGELLCAHQIEILRAGQKNCWLEVTLFEGKNRQIRRMLAALSIEVLRLIRVQVGALQLGALSKGSWRLLDADELKLLAAATEIVVV
jgi:23S rRNA pseudouridine2605 synthase